MSTTSNTTDVFRWAIGKTVVGLYTDRESDIAGRVVVLVLGDGSGIAFGTGNGSHWVVSRDDVAMRARQRRAELEEVDRDLRDVLTLEGVLPGEPR